MGAPKLQREQIHQVDHPRRAPADPEGSKPAAPTAILDRRDSARSGSAASRLAALPSEIYFGPHAVGASQTIEIPLIVSDEFIGRGVADPKITSVGHLGTTFSVAPMELTFNAHARLETLPVRFQPVIQGSHRARLDLGVSWTDGKHTMLQTSLIGRGDDTTGTTDSKKPDEWESTLGNLDRAYDDVSTARGALFEKRAIGVREALANMQIADSPTIAEAVSSTLALAALGLASGYISGAIVTKVSNRVVKLIAEAKKEGLTIGTELSSATQNAFQTALDDGGKDAFARVPAAVRSNADSKVGFFSSQEESLVDAKTNVSKRDAALKSAAKSAVEKAAPDSRERVLREHIAVARAVADVSTDEGDSARTTQYRTSLTRWMVALAKDSLGVGDAEQPGTDLEDAVDVEPDQHLWKRGARKDGVINVSFRAKRERPLGGTVKVSGMTTAALGPLKKDRRLRIRDLKMPIVASGYLMEGFDVLVLNNMIAFGKNEDGSVYWKGHSDARDTLKELTNAVTMEEAVRTVVREDIETRTLEHIESES